MSHRLVHLLVAAVVVGALAWGGVPASAGAAPVTAGNIPYGVRGSSESSRFRDSRELLSKLSGMRRGDEAYISMYSLTLDDVADAVLAADRRGVRVVFVTFKRKDHPIDGAMADIQRGLARSKTAGSRFVACSKSCGGWGDTMHLKVAALKIGARSWVRLGSGNMTRSAATRQWNQWTWLESRPLFDQARRKVLRMATTRRDTSCSKVTDKRLSVTVVYMPCRTANPMLEALRAARCRRGDVVWLAMFMYGSSATRETAELLRLKKAGCDVQLLGTEGYWSQRRLADLLDGSRVSRTYRGVSVPVWMGGPTMHDKALTLRVHDSRGRRVERVLSGSYTFGELSREANDNHVMTQSGSRPVKWNVNRFAFKRSHMQRVT